MEFVSHDCCSYRHRLNSMMSHLMFYFCFTNRKMYPFRCFVNRMKIVHELRVRWEAAKNLPYRSWKSLNANYITVRRYVAAVGISIKLSIQYYHRYLSMCFIYFLLSFMSIDWHLLNVFQMIFHQIFCLYEKKKKQN